MPLAPGSRLGTYEIVALLGAGGMGEVYRARDVRLGREVALKVLGAATAADPDRLERLEREARAAAGLNHPNIVTLHSVEDDGDVRFLTMELVDGRSLADSIVPGGMPVLRVLEIGIALADALAATHARGLVHRDLKPSNVMLTRDGRPKVLDFGLAHVATGEITGEVTRLTSAGQVVGTPSAMAPEQVRGAPLDGRADLFALGVLLYEMSTGRLPFRGTTAADVTSSILRDTPTDAVLLRSDLPPALSRLLTRCLEKDPERRIQTAKDVRNELEALRRALESGSGSAAAAARSREVTPSIAVLPFVNRGRNADDEDLADGLTEGVIAQLCKVRNLKVISRSSVMSFRDREADLGDVAARLGVRSVLEGSVRRAGDRVRINAQLVDVASGRHVWAETYDRRMTDLFELQDEVALEIAKALKAELSPDERARLQRAPIRDVAAYELYLRGRREYSTFRTEAMRHALTLYERAVERDPDLGPAWVGVAVALVELNQQGETTYPDHAVRAKAAAARALALDPESSEAHGADAEVRLVYDLDRVGAEAAFRRAIELSPGNADAYNALGRMFAGIERYDEAIEFQRRAHELDPLTHQSDLATTLIRAGRHRDAERFLRGAIESDPNYPRARATLGWALFLDGRRDEGIAELETAVELTGGESIWLGQLGELYGLAGRPDDARAVLARLEDPARTPPASPYHRAYVHVGLGDFDRAVELLESAYERRGAIHGMKGSFVLAPLRGHPGFEALLDRVGRA